MVENKVVTFARSELACGAAGLLDALEAKLGAGVLRWYVTEASSDAITVEATVIADGLRTFTMPSGSRFRPGKSCVLSIIPTGVGCEIGGYAGDASTVTRLLSHCADHVITNPNAVNASDFVGALDRVIYTEGYCIDLFCKGMVDLWVPTANKVGLVVERAEAWKMDLVFNVVNAIRAIHGVNIVKCVVTEGPIGSRSTRNPSGAYVGTIDHPEVLFAATEKLVREGCNAIGVTTNIQGLDPDEYVEHFVGKNPNPMGGIEAVISHLLVNRFGVPAAHAPMVNLKGGRVPNERRTDAQAPKRITLKSDVVDARAAGELVSASGLACVLIGLNKAPQLRDVTGTQFTDVITLKDVFAVVAPASTLGGVPVLAAQRDGIPIIAVRDNGTILDVTRERMGFTGVIEVANYAEAAGVLVALRNGVSLASIYRPLSALTHSVKSESQFPPAL